VMRAIALAILLLPALLVKKGESNLWPDSLKNFLAGLLVVDLLLILFGL
jgi:hypothetical protein